MYHKKNQRGFTLIESLLYLILMSILLIAIGTIVIDMLYYKTKINAINEVSYNARYVLEKIDDLTSQATGINYPLSGASSSSLSLISAAPNNPIIIDIFSGRVRVKKGSSAAAFWTSDEVQVKSMSFNNLTSGTSTPNIRMILELEATNQSGRPQYSAGEKYYFSINLRKQ